MPNNKLDNQPDNHPHNSNTSSKQQVTADNGGFVSNVVQLQVDGPITNSPITINLLNNDNNTPAKTNRTTIHNLPERNRFFTGRDEILEKLQEALLTNQSVAINQLSSTSPKQAISGLGGMGKTRTTLEFCYRHIDDYKHIFWVKSENETSFNNSYLELAKLLNLSLNSHPNTSTNAPLTVEQVIALVKDWLATNSHWLIVLDNLEEFNFIKLYLPNNHKGYILITTRSQALGHFAKSIKLDKMDILTGSLFLLRRATLLQENDPLDLASENHKSNAQEIAKEMDGLPLALEQAGAFIEQTRCSLDKYLTAYKDVRNTANMLKNDGQDTHDHISVFSTFKLALDKVKEKNLTAAKLLEACSFLDPDLIPIEIFTQAGNLLGDELSTLKSNNYEFDKCLKLLINYSLIERDSNNNSLSIHRLVQNVIRESIYNGTKQHWTEKLIKALGILCPRETTNPANWSTYRRLLPTVLALSELSNISGFVSPEVATLFNQFGIYSDTQAIYSQSLYFFQQALSIRKQHFGHNHPEVANILHNIAGVYQSQGKYDKALIFSNQALKISKQHFGNNHPDVASSIVGIATLYDSQGKHDEALNFYQQALEIYKHHFGGNHINVAKTLHNIATTYYYQSKHDKALDFYQQALPIKKQHLGYNHPETAKTLIGIANIHYSQGKYDEALDFYQQALEIYKTHFGDKHPDVAMALNNIAMVYKSQNKYIDASNFFHQALSTRKQSLGNYHPYVARTLENLGNLSQAMTKETEAMEYYKEALAIYDKTFPSGHPWIADLLDTYSKLSLKLNKNDEAKVLQNRLHRLNATNLSD